MYTIWPSRQTSFGTFARAVVTLFGFVTTIQADDIVYDMQYDHDIMYDIVYDMVCFHPPSLGAVKMASACHSC